jgi:peptide/nickel transport system substrate-binding protein
MKRREFLRSMTALTAAGAFSAPAVWSPARAQARKETLLVTENGPNNLDIHGVGTNRPGYEASWNCYDRLIRNDKRTLADGSVVYDRDKFVPELAEDMTTSDMSITFKLRKDAKFQDGTPVTAKDVKWSFDRASRSKGCTPRQSLQKTSALAAAPPRQPWVKSAGIAPSN